MLNTLKSLLTSKGFKVGKKGDFLITAIMKYTKINMQRKELFYNWTVNVEVMNNQNEIIFNFEKNGRDGGNTESTAFARVKYSAKKAIRKQFIFEFENYLNSLLGN